MKTVILAGGLGTRIGEETSARPKPMVEIGGKPILWHIMKIYSTLRVGLSTIDPDYQGTFIKELVALMAEWKATRVGNGCIQGLLLA